MYCIIVLSWSRESLLHALINNFSGAAIIDINIGILHLA